MSIIYLNETEFVELASYSSEAPRHVLEFDHIPSNNELRIAAEASLTRPYRVTGYRYIAQTENKLRYLIEEVDVDKEFSRERIPPSDSTITVPISYRCTNCGERYNGWIVLAKRHYDNKAYYYTTEYCPKCPPISVEMWLARIGVLKEKPQYQYTSEVQLKEAARVSDDLDLGDMPDF